jgi:hypothetical protein
VTMKGRREAEQRDGVVMALNEDGKGAGEKKKNKRETRRIGNMEKGKNGEREREEHGCC